MVFPAHVATALQKERDIYDCLMGAVLATMRSFGRPVLDKKIDPMATVHQLKPGATPKLRVLVVEDNLDSVHAMAMLVKMMGHEVQFAINGFAALDVARQFRPDVVLLDIGLPDFSGYEIVRQLKYEEAMSKTRFIAISAMPAEQHRQRALDAGCEEFYAKPIDPKVLGRLLGDESGR